MATSSTLVEEMYVDDAVPSSVSVQTMSNSEVSSWTERLIGSVGGCITADSRRNLLQTYLQRQEAGTSKQPLPVSSRVDNMPFEEVSTLILNHIGSFAECKDEQSLRSLLKTYVINKELKGQISRDLPDHDSEQGNLDLLRPEARFMDNLGYGDLATMMEALSMEVTKSPNDDAYRLKQVLFCGDRNESSQEMRNMVDETMKKYNDIKEKLVEYYSDLIDTVQEESFKKEMSKVTDERYPDYEKELLSTKTMLQDMTAEFDIIITGETSAGKSTFLNVLLGESILQKGHLPTTASLCRLHNSENRKIEYEAENGTVNIPLADSNEMKKKLISINEQLRLNDRDDEPLKIIDVYWPISSLHENVVLVDTPGIGERDALTKKVAEHVPNSAGYIFIIDSSRAGGVLDSGIKKLIEAVAKSALTEEQIKGLDNVFFVCNKWDLVPKGEKEVVFEKIKQNLSKCCGQLRDWQIVQFNAQLELQLLEWKANLTKNIKALFKSLETLMTSTIAKRLGDKHRWLHSFVKEVLGFLNARMNTESKSKERIHADIQEAYKQLELATSKIRQCKEVHKMIDREEKELSQVLQNYLESIDVRSEIFNSSNSAPKMSKVKKTEPELINSRLQEVILEWARADIGPLQQASDRVMDACNKIQAEIGSIFNYIEKYELGFNMQVYPVVGVPGVQYAVVAFNILNTSYCTDAASPLVPVIETPPDAGTLEQQNLKSPVVAEIAKSELLSRDQVNDIITDLFSRRHRDCIAKFQEDTERKIASISAVMLRMEHDKQINKDTRQSLRLQQMNFTKWSECLEELKKYI